MQRIAQSTDMLADRGQRALIKGDLDVGVVPLVRKSGQRDPVASFSTVRAPLNSTDTVFSSARAPSANE
jgi:hypothetical protein